MMLKYVAFMASFCLDTYRLFEFACKNKINLGHSAPETKETEVLFILKRKPSAPALLLSLTSETATNFPSYICTKIRLYENFTCRCQSSFADRATEGAWI